MRKETTTIKCDICGKELSLSGYPFAWEDIKRTHMQSYSTWEGYETEEQICSACWSEAFGEKKHRQTIKDRIKEYDTALKKCENLKNSLNQEKEEFNRQSDKILKIKKLLDLGIFQLENNGLKISVSKCKARGIYIEVYDDIMNLSLPRELYYSDIPYRD